MRNERLLKVSRLAGLTDGVFAIAMTILVFDLRLPHGTTVANLSTVLTANILHNVFVYAGSFIILGTQWIGINFQHGFLDRINRPYLWMNVFYLMSAGIMPFSASLVSSYPTSPISISFFALNLICASILQLIAWQSGCYYKLYNANYTPVARKAVIYRIGILPLFYIASLIMAHWNTTFAFILLIIPPLVLMIPGKVDRYIKKIEEGL